MKSRIGKNNPNWKGGGTKRCCRICGIDFIAETSKVKIGKGIFCSVKCQMVNQSRTRKGIKLEAVVGKKNGFWKGGITPEVRKIRNDIRYKEWRISVFIRDNFTCQKCGQKRGNINAHHKKRFSVIIDDMRQKFPLLSIQDIAGHHKDLWKTLNGITLCKTCHKKEHKPKETI
jgi:5-methylcytosine-specific restriction endonuclease McrA